MAASWNSNWVVNTGRVAAAHPSHVQTIARAQKSEDKRNRLAALMAAAVALAGWITPAGAVELVVYSSAGMRAALTDIQPIYE